MSEFIKLRYFFIGLLVVYIHNCENLIFQIDSFIGTTEKSSIVDMWVFIYYIVLFLVVGMIVNIGGYLVDVLIDIFCYFVKLLYKFILQIKRTFKYLLKSLYKFILKTKSIFKYKCIRNLFLMIKKRRLSIFIRRLKKLKKANDRKEKEENNKPTANEDDKNNTTVNEDEKTSNIYERQKKLKKIKYSLLVQSEYDKALKKASEHKNLFRDFMIVSGYFVSLYIYSDFMWGFSIPILKYCFIGILFIMLCIYTLYTRIMFMNITEIFKELQEDHITKQDKKESQESKKLTTLEVMDENIKEIKEAVTKKCKSKSDDKGSEK